MPTGTLEDIASQLSEDPEFQQLGPDEQDQVFAELARDLERPSVRPLNPFVRAAATAPLSPLLHGLRASTVAVPEEAKPPLFSTLGTIAGMSTRVPFAGYLGGVAGQAIGEAVKKEPGTTPDLLETTASGLGTAAAASGIRSLWRGGRILTSRARREALAQRVLKAPAARRRIANRSFGRTLSKMPGTVDLSQEINSLNQGVSQTAQGTSLLKAAKRVLPKDLQGVLEDSTKAVSLTATQATQLRTAVNSISGIARELGRTNPKYLNVERPFVEFASVTGKKMSRLPGKAALDVAHKAKMRDIERVEPFLRKEKQLAYGGTPVFRTQVGKVVPDLRATGAAGRIFSSKTKQDIQGVRNVKRAGALISAKFLSPFFRPFSRVQGTPE